MSVEVDDVEIIEALRRGLVPPDGQRELVIAVLHLRLLRKEEELELERHQHQTTTDMLKGQQSMVRQLQDELRNRDAKAEWVEAEPATNGA